GTWRAPSRGSGSFPCEPTGRRAWIVRGGTDMPIRSDMARIIGVGLFSGPKRSLRSLRNRFEGAPQLWEERRHRRVRWIEGKSPDTEEAEAIRDAIIGQGYDTYGEVT